MCIYVNLHIGIYMQIINIKRVYIFVYICIYIYIYMCKCNICEYVDM